MPPYHTDVRRIHPCICISFNSCAFKKAEQQFDKVVTTMEAVSVQYKPDKKESWDTK